MKKRLFIIAMLFVSLVAYASNEIDGIYYNLKSSTAEAIVAGVNGTFLRQNHYVVNIPSSVYYNSKEYTVTEIQSNAFRGSRVASITIPGTVKSIDNSAFENCINLTSIIVNSDNTIYDSRNNCNAIIESSTNTLIAGCKSTTIPNSVTAIGNGAFTNCTSMTSISIPTSVKSIGADSFSGCTGLTSISIPTSVKSIEAGSFSGCTGLKSINIPNSVTTIGRGTFQNCI